MVSQEYVLYTVKEISSITKGTVKGSENIEILGVVLDSRKVEKGMLFVCMQGEKTNGHAYLKDVASKLSCAFVEKKYALENEKELNELVAQNNIAVIIVENSLIALQVLASHHVLKFPKLLRIGVTGSSGKTTTKELLRSVFEVEKKVVSNQGNLNSDTGLPISVFAIRPWHEVGIFEMGMNHKGEMETLAKILKPHVVIITNIGNAHIGNLGSRDAIAYEKKMAVSQFSGTETLFIPEDDDYADYLAQNCKGSTVYYGKTKTKGLDEWRDLGLDGSIINWEGFQISLSLPGVHNVKNALGTISVATCYGISSNAIKQGIEAIPSLSGRSEVLRGKYTVLKDCYNANPESMVLALDFCDDCKVNGKKIYVLGSMFELGSSSKHEHELIGKRILSSNADYVFFFGSEMRYAKSMCENNFSKPVFYFDVLEDLASAILKIVNQDDFILLKASRGMELERLLPYFGF